MENVSNWTYCVTAENDLPIVGEDPTTCEHEWWEDTTMTYTSSPPAYKQKCRLCGITRYRYGATGTVSPRWKKVE